MNLLNCENLSEVKHYFKYGTLMYYECDLMEMIDSIYCYDNYGNNYDKYLNNKYITDYYLDDSYCNGKSRLSKDIVERIVKDRVDYLCKHAIVIHNVATDNEGLTYNRLEFKESEEN